MSLTAVLVLALTLIAPTALWAASSTVPTLGLRVNSEVYADQPSPTLQLTSRATAPTLVVMTLPPGWQLAKTRLEMAPGQEAQVPFTTIGPPASMTTRQTLRDPIAGTTSGALVLTTKLLSSRPIATDWTLAWTLALVLMAIVLALVTMRWLSRNVRLSRR